ncbi:hypothetical protein B0H11DRAFT_2261158 [Mycena galericulata]|nr:hypothetical protein B0H11DRAFT_2261158 [Mycena galericulata]
MSLSRALLEDDSLLVDARGYLVETQPSANRAYLGDDVPAPLEEDDAEEDDAVALPDGEVYGTASNEVRRSRTPPTAHERARQALRVHVRREEARAEREYAEVQAFLRLHYARNEYSRNERLLRSGRNANGARLSTRERSRMLQMQDELAGDLGQAGGTVDGGGRTPLIQHSILRVGVRRRLNPPVSRDTLYLTTERPPELDEVKSHHVCRICHGVKSHPVSYKCGHSHCYVCIRLWLELSWKCPICNAKIDSEPFRHFGEEDGIAFDYPGWVDKSVVNYSWAGLKFPSPSL